MAKRKISAKEAVADIRAGLDDAALMKKYTLSSDGLQSLFDKLVHAGFIDLAEVHNRLPGILGTVVVSDSLIARVKDGSRERLQAARQPSSPLVNAQEAARDIRLGLNDDALMAKFRLTPKGLQSLFQKLEAAGLITQLDLDRRRILDTDHTIDLKEEKLSFSDALEKLGLADGQNLPVEIKAPPEPPKTVRDRKGPAMVQEAPPGRKDRKSVDKTVQQGPLNAPLPAWYDRPTILGLLLVGLFPLGFYGLYRSSALSHLTKALILLAWVALAVTCALLLLKII